MSGRSGGASASEVVSGTLRGEFAVTSDGAASYTLPLATPPGTAGMAPSLTLSYHSSSGNDLFGVGWRLSGLSSITRVGATPATDGFRAGVDWSARDRFSLDGQRLVAVAGTHGAPDAVYHTEQESWRRVVPGYGTATAGPERFVVHEKDGRVLEYGTTADSRVLSAGPGSAVRVWALARVTDRNGNYMTYRYAQADGGHVLERIDYTGNTGVVPRRSVRFEYEARPDPSTRYVAGSRVRTTRRATRITAHVDERPVLSWSLAYAPPGATGKSRLASVTERDAEGRPLAPTRFDWQDGDARLLASQPTPLPGSVTYGGTFLPMDVAGDGRVGFLNANRTGGTLTLDLFTARSDGPGFDAPLRVPATTPPLPTGGQFLPVDVNGDGHTDLVYAVRAGNELRLTVFTAAEEATGRWTLRAGTPGAGGPPLPAGGELHPADVDGDGATDLVHVRRSGNGTEFAILRSTGEGYQRGAVTTTTLPPGGTAHAFDVNGDGMTDIVYAYTVRGALQLAVLVSDGERLTLRAAESLPGEVRLSYTGTLVPMDLNGDGLVDLVHAGRAMDGSLVLTPLISTGAGFAPQPSQPLADVPFNAVLLPAELNGDGMTDLAVVVRTPAGQTLHALLSTGDAFRRAAAPQSLLSLPQGAILPLDLTGVGRSALLNLAQSADALVMGAVLPAGEAPDLLTRITNGLGGTREIRYQPITDSRVYRASRAGVSVAGMLHGPATGATYAANAQGVLVGSPAATAPTMTGAFPHYVVASHARDDGQGGRQEYRHSYADAAVDVARGRGWLGFRSQRSTDVEAGTTTTSEYRRDFPFTGMVDTNTVARSADGVPLTRTRMTWEARDGRGATRQALNTGVTTELYTAGRLDATVRTTTTHDAYGNALLQSELGDGSGAALYTRREYLNDEARWRIGFTTATTQSADAEGARPLTRDATVYDAERANAVAHRSWHDQAGSWLESTTGYDAFGNPTSLTDHAGATRTITYDPDFHSWPATETTPPNTAGAILTTTYRHEPVFGQRVATIDANGVTTGQRIDGFGRVIATTGQDPRGKVVELTTRDTGTDAIGAYQELRERLDWEGTRWQWRREYLDGHERVTRTVSLGADGVTRIVVDKEYTGRNLIRRETLAHVEGTTPAVITYAYDELGRTTRIDRPADGGGQRTDLLEYPDSHTLLRREGAGTALERATRSRQGLFNGKYLPVETTDATGARSTIGYDAIGRTVRGEDAMGTVTTIAYDSVGNAVHSATAQDGVTIREERATYDLVARRATRRDARGRTTTITMDAHDRPLQLVDDTGARTAWRYDDPSVLGAGRLCGVSLSDGTGYAFAYDANGNQLSIDVAIGGERWRIARSFLPGNRLALTTYPDGAEHRARYTPGGMIESVVAGAGDLATSVAMSEYDANGKPGVLTLGNGVRETLRYNVGGQLHTHEITGPSRSMLHGTRFHWNAVDDLARIDDLVTPSRGYAFTYDPAGRLAEATGPYARPQRFAYDAAGNLVEKDGAAQRYRNGLVVSSGELALDYDASGNTTGVRGRGAGAADLRLDYDAHGRLATAGGCTFSYDHQGRRVAKRVPGGATTVYVAPDYEVVLHADGTRQHTRYLRSPFGVAASMTVMEGGAATPAVPMPGVPVPGACYFHRNQINSTTLVTSATGETLATVEYLPFGEVSTFTGADVFRARFAGRELDRETGLYEFGARYYLPHTGRFVSADDGLGGPLDRHDALNAYAYVLNSPVSNVDPTGRGFLDHVLPYILDGLLIVAGIAVIATTPFGGAASAVLGGMLLGAGINGLVYDITLDVTGKRDDFSWRHWGVQVGIGAAVGAVSGGLAHGAGAFANAMVSAGRTGFAVGAAGRIALMATVGAIDGAAANAFSTAMTNLDYGRAAEQGVGWAALVGGVAGGVAGGASSWLAGTNMFSRAPDILERSVIVDHAGRFVFDTTRVVSGGIIAMAALRIPAMLAKGGGNALIKFGPQWSW